MVVAGWPRVVPAPRLFSLPTLPRVSLEVARDYLVVQEDLNLPRGDWPGGDVQLFVAFGAPGAPKAMDARVGAASDAGREPPKGASLEDIPLTRAPRRPPPAFALLGPPWMAGVALHLSDAAFRRATEPTGVARIRLRALHELPTTRPEGGQEVVVRLGTWGGAPLALGRIEVTSLAGQPDVAGAEAHLCGPDADPYPLAVSLAHRPAQPPPPPAPVAPVLSVRHASDDLCVRFWLAGTRPDGSR